MSTTAGALVLIWSTTVCAQPQFVGRYDVPLGEAPRAIAAADLSGDGWTDLVLAGTAPGVVTVLISHGVEDADNGDRYTATDYAVGGGPFEIALGDLNRDGHIDIAVANADANAITLLFNRGHGDFAAPVNLPFPDNPRGIAIADFNRDGIPDIVATKYMGSTLEVLYGAGDGTFPRRLALQAPVNSQGVTTGDFDLDGWGDFAVAAASGTIRVYRMFATGAVINDLHPSGTGWNVIAASDLDRDGRLDLAVASTGSSVVRVLYNRASGWVASAPVPVASSPRGIAIADLDRDGTGEIVVAGRAESTVTVITRAANGALSTTGLAAGSGARAVVATDLDHGNGPEIATVNEFGRSVTILYNQTHATPGGFAFDHVMLPALYEPAVFGVADFNHNGKMDVVRSNSVFLDGTTQSRSLGNLPGRPLTIGGGVGDFNRDGNADVVYAGTNSFQVFLGTGTGEFTDGPVTTEPGASRIRVADLNRDGRPDVVVQESGYQIAPGLGIFLGVGDGTFTKAGRIDGTFNAFEVGDVDRDGIVDVVTTAGNGVTVFLGDGRGGVKTSKVTDAGNPRFGFALGDLTGDGILDMAVVDSMTYNWGGIANSSKFSVLRGLGDGTFEDFGQYDTMQADGSDFHVLYGLVIADLTGDGAPDVFTSHGELYPGTGLGAPLLDPARFEADTYRDALAADVNGDGLLDVLGYTHYGGDAFGPTILYNTTRTPNLNRPPTGLLQRDHVTWPYDQTWSDEDENELDAGPVTDPDLHKIRYRWTLADGTVVSTASAWTPRLNPGTYEVTVTADDFRGGSISDTFTVDVPPFKEMVLTPGWDASVYGAWQSVDDPTADQGRRVWHPDAGAPKLTTPLANPANFFEIEFLADPTQEYKLWVRMKADNNYWGNDSVFAQFTGAKDASGNPIYQIGTTSALTVNLEECSGCGLSGWGWEDDAWGAVNLNGTTLRFPEGGPQTLRIQTREDGVSIDQIVLSAVKYKTTRPGTAKNDTTLLPRTGPYLTPPQR